MNLHSFGLQGVKQQSYYESNHDAFRRAEQDFALRAKLLERAPNLALFLASDPENKAQAETRSELLAVLGAALEMRGVS